MRTVAILRPLVYDRDFGGRSEAAPEPLDGRKESGNLLSPADAFGHPKRIANMTRSSLAFTLALVVTLLAAPALAQTELADSLTGSAAEYRGSGSAAILSGSVGIYHIFVSEDKDDWSEVDIDLALANVEQSLLYLQYHAELHGVEIVFQEQAVHVVYEPGVQDMNADPQWSEQLMMATGAMSGNDLVGTIRKTWGVEHVIIVVHANKPGLSYALAWRPDADPTYSAERVVLYTHYPDARPTAAATYAHEILHLFGACDLYYPYDTEDTRRQHAARMFPDDIMLRVDYNISNLNVGDFTAYRIGWHNEIREAHQEFEN